MRTRCGWALGITILFLAVTPLFAGNSLPDTSIVNPRTGQTMVATGVGVPTEIPVDSYLAGGRKLEPAAAATESVLAAYTYCAKDWCFNYAITQDDGIEITQAYFKNVFVLYRANVPFLARQGNWYAVQSKFELTPDRLAVPPRISIFPSAVVLTATYVFPTEQVTQAFYFFTTPVLEGYFLSAMAYAGPAPLAYVPFYADWDVDYAGFDTAYVDNPDGDAYPLLFETGIVDAPNLRLVDRDSRFAVWFERDTSYRGIDYIHRYHFDQWDTPPMADILWPSGCSCQDIVHTFIVPDVPSGWSRGVQYHIDLAP